MTPNVEPPNLQPANGTQPSAGIAKQQIPREEVAAHSLSFSDYNGRVFCWQGNLYRAIPSQQAPLYQELFDRGAVRSLIQKKLLVPTTLTPLTLDAADMVLHHRRIPFVSYPPEWCSAMFKAATLLHLDFCIELDRYDCTTDDAHPINILFEGTAPYFVDFGSINRLRPDRWYPWPWPPYEQFCQTFLYPLLLKAHGQNRLARWSLYDFENGVPKSELDALIDRPLSRLRLAEIGARLVHLSGQPLLDTPALLRPFRRKGCSAIGRVITRLSGIKSSRGGFLQQVRDEVANISLPNCENAQDSSPNHSLQVQQILQALQPHSVLTINGDEAHGSYALLAANCGSKVVALETQEANASRLYQQAEAANANILPLWMNFASPSYGLSNSFLAPAHQRLKCELVMALSLDSELILERGFSFVVKRLAVFSDRWLLIEFATRADPTLTTRWEERVISCPWYELNNFVAALQTQFQQVEVLPSAFENCNLLLCEK